MWIPHRISHCDGCVKYLHSITNHGIQKKILREDDLSAYINKYISCYIFLCCN